MADLDKAVATQLANIEKRTGKSLAELTAIVQQSRITKHGEIVAMLGECTARAGNHCERRPQVVRDRGEQCIAQALGLGGYARRLRLLGKLRTLQRQSQLSRERFQEVSLLRQKNAPTVFR